MRTEGETFQPCPRSRAAFLPVPSVAMPALPFSPVKFSGLIERVWAAESRQRLPMFVPKPSKPAGAGGVSADGCPAVDHTAAATKAAHRRER